jgi:hypothetical protein
MEERRALFVAKIDIEGGETALFRTNTAWVGDAAMVTIELHDWLYPAERTSHALHQFVSSRLPCPGQKNELHAEGWIFTSVPSPGNEAPSLAGICGANDLPSPSRR